MRNAKLLALPNNINYALSKEKNPGLQERRIYK